MYAILKIQKKQYKITENQTINVDFINNKIGTKLNFTKVQAIFNSKKIFLKKEISKVKIITQIISHKKLKKILILKFRRRKHHKKKIGFRKKITCIKIKKIQFSKI